MDEAGGNGGREKMQEGYYLKILPLPENFGTTGHGRLFSSNGLMLLHCCPQLLWYSVGTQPLHSSTIHKFCRSVECNCAKPAFWSICAEAEVGTCVVMGVRKWVAEEEERTMQVER